MHDNSGSESSQFDAEMDSPYDDLLEAEGISFPGSQFSVVCRRRSKHVRGPHCASHDLIDLDVPTTKVRNSFDVFNPLDSRRDAEELSDTGQDSHEGQEHEGKSLCILCDLTSEYRCGNCHGPICNGHSFVCVPADLEMRV